MRIFSIPFIVLILSGCDGTDGLFGHSKTKEEAKANGSNVLEYLPNKSSFKLLDGTEMKIDTAWTEVSFTYKNNKRIYDSSYGSHFAIPYYIKDPASFTFNFHLLDTTNQMFTNGREKGATQLCPKKLYDTMRVFLEQKDPDTSKGWTNPIITDTVTFVRLK
jgi:hypothetical protein